MDDAGPQSLFAVVYYFQKDPRCYRILQLDHKDAVDQKVFDHEDAAHLKVDEKVFHHEAVEHLTAVCFNQPRALSQIEWLFSPPTSSTEDLYMVPNWQMVPHWYYSEWSSPGYQFNIRTGSFGPIDTPLSSGLSNGHVVNLRGHMYYISYNNCDGDSVFQCYDPDKRKWNALKSFHDSFEPLGRIVATAVWRDTILFNVNFDIIWAYDVSRNKWYPVEVNDVDCYGIVGEAVVIGDIIYALAKWPFYSVVALSIRKEDEDVTDGDPIFECSLLSKTLVPGMKPLLLNDVVWMRTRHLVHLGKDNFCIVVSWNSDDFDGYQTIQVIYIKLKPEGGSSLIVIGNCVHKVKIQDDDESFSFIVRLCFSLPECNTTVLKQAERLDFLLDPLSKNYYASKQVQEKIQEEIVSLRKFGFHVPSELEYDSSQTNIIDESSQTNIIDEQVPIRHDRSDSVDSELATATLNHAHEEGHSIYVRKLPPNATVRQLEERLKKFGPIKMDGMRVEKNLKGQPFAYVEFESATSKQLAIEASPITMRGCRVEILEKGINRPHSG